MSERREVRGWVPVDFASREATAVLPYRLAVDDVPVVIRHADDDAALLEEPERLRGEVGLPAMTLKPHARDVLAAITRVLNVADNEGAVVSMAVDNHVERDHRAEMEAADGWVRFREAGRMIVTITIDRKLTDPESGQ